MAGSGDIALWLTGEAEPRSLTRRYQDPLELVWLHCLQALGWRLERSSEVFASWDGAGVLTLSTPEHMDPDDSLAQLIFHEVCHALVEGPDGWSKPDWGLENQDSRHLAHELACHRVQASLATPFGLRDFMAVTTDWRPHYDALPEDPMGVCPFAGKLDQEARRLALGGLERASERPWVQAVQSALSRTQLLRSLCAPLAPPSSIWAQREP